MPITKRKIPLVRNEMKT